MATTPSMSTPYVMKTVKNPQPVALDDGVSSMQVQNQHECRLTGVFYRPTTTKLTIGEGAVVCSNAILKGEIIIGPGCILHPYCQILAMNGPISLGSSNIIEEGATLVNDLPNPMAIGDRNLIEVGSRIENSTLEDDIIVESRAFVAPGCHIASGCTVALAVGLIPATNLQPNTIVWGPTAQQRQKEGERELHRDMLAKHVDILRLSLVKYHRLLPVGTSTLS